MAALRVEEALVAIGKMISILIVSGVGLLFFVSYLEHKENMARIQNNCQEIESEEEDE